MIEEELDQIISSLLDILSYSSYLILIASVLHRKLLQYQEEIINFTKALL